MGKCILIFRPDTDIYTSSEFIAVGNHIKAGDSHGLNVSVSGASYSFPFIRAHLICVDPISETSVDFPGSCLPEL